ncbi:hypothetical protein N5079_07235 [Planotetraspora sp. A-T 1434]|uniref:AfsR/SARP family transcriptional regulator n=1 Tax=Planotetraspora sp. A-T 1434 TaxID=2979219 RepID=UPI0021C19581|nr:BTAD domain-containing putative transcriptional regulator [Planotetraspora sp. A-T 1434]MCT9930013.1 hypothetical protein [Planotetraspora sp. A-T 1434]
MEVHSTGEVISISGRKQRVFLLSLLLKINRPVALNEIADVLWDGEPPASASSNVRNHVVALRRSLAAMQDVGVVAGDRSYKLVASPERLDLTRFERLATDGRVALFRRDYMTAVEHLDQAIALWRGPAGGGISCGKPLAVRLRMLHEQWAAAMEERAEAQLAMERNVEAAAGMRVLLTEEPLRERAWGLLIRALYLSGDASGALRAYSEARLWLVSELGLEPGDELRQLQQAILRRDPELPRLSWRPQGLIPAGSLDWC